MQKANVLISKSDSRMKNAGTKKAPFQGLCGVPGATRTPGLPLRRRSLYPTELREHGLWGVAQGECTSSALGGERSILLSYGRISGSGSALHGQYCITGRFLWQAKAAPRISRPAGWLSPERARKRCAAAFLFDRA